MWGVFCWGGCRSGAILCVRGVCAAIKDVGLCGRFNLPALVFSYSHPIEKNDCFLWGFGLTLGAGAWQVTGYAPVWGLLDSWAAQKHHLRGEEMPVEYSEWGGPCKACGQNRLFRSATVKPNHVLHAILTIFTCFLWGIVWLILSATTSSSPYRCTVCGNNFQK